MQKETTSLGRCTMRKFASFVFGSVMGAMFGAVVALLIAPSSGEELQARAKERVATLRDEVQNAYEVRTAQLQAELEALSSKQEEDEKTSESE
jgi:gas vesicle protein